MNKIGLVITNYNGLRYLSAYLPDMANACKEQGITLVVTDNGSTDGSVEYLKNGGYRYTVNPILGKGYASNLNNGIRYINSIGEFDYLVLSNNDISFNTALFHCFHRVCDLLKKKYPRHGLIGFDEVLKDRIDHFKNFEFNKYDPELIAAATDMIGFFFFAIPVNVIKDVGYFDEEYFIYGEDNDYFTRVTRAGYTCVQTHLPVMHYAEGSSTNSKQTSWYVYRNAFLFAQKNLGFIQCLKMLASFINQIYNPFHKPVNPSQGRVKRNGFWYNNYLLLKSLAWNTRYFIKKKLKA